MYIYIYIYIDYWTYDEGQVEINFK